MINPFKFIPLPRIVFGRGKIEELPQLLSEYGFEVLLILGSESFSKTGHLGSLQEALADCGTSFYVEQISGEPSPEAVDTIVSKYRQHNLAAVAAVGGGSVLDGGKAVSAMLCAPGSVTDYLEGVGSKNPIGKKIPFLAVPTTAGTGSEVTCNAVISEVGRNGFKKSLRHEKYMPDIAVIDPALTLDCPQTLTSNCAMDAFSQLVESYLSTKASPMTDDLALGAVRRLKQSLWRICNGDSSMEDRENMSYGACISGITLANAGLGVIHGFASTIGGLFPIPHGVVCGTLLAAGNGATLRKLRKTADSSVGLGKYAELGRIFSDKERASESYYQDSFIRMLEEVTEEVRPDPLGKYGVGSADLERIVSQSGCKNNPVQLEPEEMIEILAARLGE